MSDHVAQCQHRLNESREANADLIVRAVNSFDALVAALDDSAKGLEGARKALETAQSCMGAHEMQDSKYDNARDLIYTWAVAAHATHRRVSAALAQAKGSK